MTRLESLRTDVEARRICVVAAAGVWREYRHSIIGPTVADFLAEQVEHYERAVCAVLEEEARVEVERVARERAS